MRGRFLSFIFICHTAKGRRYSRDMQRLWQNAAYMQKPRQRAANTAEIHKDRGKPHIQPRYAKAAESRLYAKTAAHTARPPRCFSLEAKFFEQKAPDHIQPADNDTGRNGYDYTYNQSE